MQLNIKKIDERIQKLQEIKRIAADPELMTLLVEFIAREDELKASASHSEREAAPAVKAEAPATPHQSDARVVEQVVKGVDSSGSGIWSRNRG